MNLIFADIGKKNNMNYFLENGYIDIAKILNRPYTFQLVISARGTGKTYSGIKYLLDSKQKFIFMRRTQTQIDMIRDTETSPFVVNDPNIVIKPINKYIAGVYNGEENSDGIIDAVGKPIGLCMALSTISNIRGFSTADVKIIMFDEITGEEHERMIKGERGKIIYNMYETINRNRELNGLEPVKLIMFCNSDRIDAPILDALNVSDIIRKMESGGYNCYENTNRRLGVYWIGESPISMRKKDTALYQMAQDEEFEKMAIENKFSYNQSDIKSMPLKEFHFLICGGGISIYKHKDNGNYYVIDSEQGTPQTAEIILKNYRGRINQAIKKQKIYYQNLRAKNKFYQILKM